MADSYFKKLKKRLKENKQDRYEQFANYLNMIDNLESKKFYSRNGRVEIPETNLRLK